MFNQAWWSNMSDELKGVLVVVLCGFTIIMTFIITNFAFNVIAVRSGLHQQNDPHRDGGFNWVK